MKSRFLYAIIVAAAVLADTRVMAQRRAARVGDQQEAGQNGWLSSLDEGRSEARRSGKPLMVVIRCVP